MKSISCKEAVQLILKKEESKITLVDRIRLWRHLAICSLCRVFSSQNQLLNRGMKQLTQKHYALTDEDKDKIIHNVLNDSES